ncbi:Inner membrane protein YccS [Fundidesulfovibrio magnetotacticus]|uniref:Inner membrane protein YccS n=1 Tax=Fundidesulfovibrio magnetotacticus TaxID=2730080 RepID=A0A6V8LZ46_9BACT|nr:FUSC family protein [Fundidesulfovibrio magnetotacticus]GFK93505.1 Inner membrane protein YccS [Fundidesulfovibrio magnetotacticus]
MKLLKPSSQHIRHALKTALAAVTTYALVSLLNLEQGYWAVISVIIVMQNNLGGSYQAGVNRIAGTAVGAALGCACLAALGSGAVALGLGVGLSILVCAYFVHLHESFRMAGITATIIILLGNQHGSFLAFSVERFLEIGLGVAIALGVSLFVWPSRAGGLLKKGVVKALNDEAAFYAVLLSCRAPSCDEGEEEYARRELAATRQRNRALLEEAKREPAGFSRQEHVTVSLYNFTERIAEHLLAMEHAVHHEELEGLHSEVAAEMDLLAQTTVTAMTHLALAVSQGHAPGSLEGVRRAVASAEDALGMLRTRRVLPGYSLESIMRFYSYYYNMREVAVELLDMAERAAILNAE